MANDRSSSARNAIAWVVAALVVACGGPSEPGAGAGATGGAEGEEIQLPDTPISRERAQEIAMREARAAGIDPGGYRVVSVERVDEGSVVTPPRPPEGGPWRGRWLVLFEVSPGPVPPGGHFGVYVDAQSGDAQLMQGE